MADRIIETLHLRTFDLGRDFERDSALLSDIDCKIGTLLLIEPSEKRQIVPRSAPILETAQIQAVVDRADPLEPRHRGALVVADRDEVSVRIAFKCLMNIWKVHLSMQSRQQRSTGHARHGQHPVIMVVMDDVELMSASYNRGKQLEVVGDGVPDGVLAQAKRLVNDRHQFAWNERIARGEKRGFNPLDRESMTEAFNDTLGASVKPWRDTFKKRCNQCDAHRLMPKQVASRTVTSGHRSHLSQTEGMPHTG
jgi:hypothetical protein